MVAVHAPFLLKNDLKGTFFESHYQANFSENILEHIIICMADLGGKGVGEYMIEVVCLSQSKSYSRF
jgi:hypothetical protein